MKISSSNFAFLPLSYFGSSLHTDRVPQCNGHHIKVADETKEGRDLLGLGAHSAGKQSLSFVARSCLCWLGLILHSKMSQIGDNVCATEDSVNSSTSRVTSKLTFETYFQNRRSNLTANGHHAQLNRLLLRSDADVLVRRRVVLLPRQVNCSCSSASTFSPISCKSIHFGQWLSRNFNKNAPKSLKNHVGC